VSHKKKPKRPPMGLEEAKRLLEEKTNEPQGRELAAQILTFLQRQLGEPTPEIIGTVLYALEHTRYTVLLMAQSRDYAEPVGPLMEASRVCARAALSTVLAMTDATPPNSDSN
jgi:hypothetical protein